jgi:glycine/D-amino acid oxidase-like deaminating enzyme
MRRTEANAPVKQLKMKTYDVIIVGGGIMGSATAYYLTKNDPTLKVTVIERDPTYARASTTLSMSNVRIQFSLKENIQISQYAFDVLNGFENEMAVDGDKPKIYYRREGNLFLVDESNEMQAKRAFKLQKSLGCRIEWWTPQKITAVFPLYETGSFLGGTYGPDDGHFDAYAALMGYKAKARSQGAEYLKNDVEKITIRSGRVNGVRLASSESLAARHIINCAGGWAAQVAATAKVNLPVVPVKRQVFTLDTAVKPKGPLPLTVLPSGLYFRTETGGGRSHRISF